MSDNHFEDYLKERLYNHVEPVEPGGWEIILAKQAAKKRQRAVARRFYFGTTLSAVAAGLLWLLLIPVFFNRPDPMENTSISLLDHTTQPIFLSDSLNTPDIENQIAQATIPSRIDQKVHLAQVSIKTPAIDTPEEEEALSTPESVPVPDTPKETTSTDSDPVRPINTYNIDDKFAERYPSKRRRSVSDKWSIALASSYSNAAGEAPFAPVRLFNSGTTKISSMIGNASGYENHEDATLSFLPPVSVGVNFQKELNTWMSIGVGVNYTLLQSKSSYSYFGGPYTIRQSLHYVGFPVSALFNFVHQPKTRVYTSVGGMVEKAVTAHSTSSSKYTSSSESSYVQGLQWSVHAGLGVEVALSKLFGIYLEPGMGYFFDCNQPRSIRTIQPALFKAEVGLRVRI
ncbi:MAG: PorT family protein [Bacteroidales bacterium]|nr:PorT family protein [Bacteroidales bacterium]